MRVINRAPSKGIAIALAALPFALAIAAYAVASAARLAANPADKLLPSFARMVETFLTLATVPDRRTGDIILWIDTAASLQRLGVGIALAALLALLFGVLIGFMPYARATLAPFVSTISLRFGGVVQDSLDRGGNSAGYDPLDFPGRVGHPSGTCHQGADARGLILANRDAPCAATFTSAADHCDTTRDSPRLDIPHICRGNRFDRRSWIPHFLGSSVFGDGCHFALRGLDRASRVPHRPSVADGIASDVP